MWGLRTPKRRDEKGAVLVLMAAFTVVMVGMAALVIDVGALNDEQRQLQNSADASALGLAQYIAAKGCVSDTGQCLPAKLVTEAQDLANGNVRDDMTAYSVSTNYTDKTVTVVTRTGSGNTTAILPYEFAQIITGKKGQVVEAAATASWAGLKSAKVIRLTLSLCEFIEATKPASNPVFDRPTEVLLGVPADACSGGPSGANLPGGFGWLDDTDGPDDCVLTPSTGEIRLGSDPGRDTPRACDLSVFRGQEILLALYNQFTDKGGGGKADYGIYGFAEFHLTGYDLPVTGKAGASCSKKPCLAGWFTRFVPIGDLGGPTLGSRVALVS
jgi:Flp pilus assembly protein TadG